MIAYLVEHRWLIAGLYLVAAAVVPAVLASAIRVTRPQRSAQ